MIFWLLSAIPFLNLFGQNENGGSVGFFLVVSLSKNNLLPQNLTPGPTGKEYKSAGNDGSYERTLTSLQIYKCKSVSGPPKQNSTVQKGEL